jgi:hypothetical protein
VSEISRTTFQQLSDGPPSGARTLKVLFERLRGRMP